MPRARHRSDPHDIAAEIIRRVNSANGRPPYVIRLSEPPTPLEKMQLIAARLQRTPTAIMPHTCKTGEEWTKRYRRMI